MRFAVATVSTKLLALHSNQMVFPMDQASRQCILCLRGISERTKPEHILLNALGGRATVEGLVCSTCNETMGHGPDQDLADSVGMLRNIANLLKGDGGGPPTIHGMQSEGMTFDVRPGMQVRPRPDDKKIRITKQDNEINIAITATSDAELHQLMENAARAIAKDLGHTEPEVIAAIHADLLRDHNRNDAIVPAPRSRASFSSERAGRSNPWPRQRLCYGRVWLAAPRRFSRVTIASGNSFSMGTSRSSRKRLRR